MKIKVPPCDSSACVEVSQVSENVFVATNPRYPTLGVPYTRAEVKKFIQDVKAGYYDLD